MASSPKFRTQRRTPTLRLYQYRVTRHNPLKFRNINLELLNYADICSLRWISAGAKHWVLVRSLITAAFFVHREPVQQATRFCVQIGGSLEYEQELGSWNLEGHPCVLWDDSSIIYDSSQLDDWSSRNLRLDFLYQSSWSIVSFVFGLCIFTKVVVEITCYKHYAPDIQAGFLL